MTPRWSRLHKLMAAAIIVAAGLSITAVTPALADGYHGRGHVEHREWRGHERHDWRYDHPYRYGYGYAYPGYYYAPPPPVYAPPSLTVVVPFR